MHIDISSSQRALLSVAASFFVANDVQAWVTGGYLRDRMLGLSARDIDLTIAGDPLALGAKLADVIDAHFVTLDSDRGHVRLVLRSGDAYVDLTPLRASDIEADLSLRDYTIDAFGADVGQVASGEFDLLDPTGGQQDLDDNLVRAISEKCLLDDPLRLFRGPRIATQLGFTIEPKTATLIERHAALILEAAPERQREELMRIFGTDTASKGIRLLDSLGLFAHVLPEMEITRGVEQPKEHEYDVLGHSFAAVGVLDFLLSEIEPQDPIAGSMWTILWHELEWCEGLREHFQEEIVLGTPRSALLKFTGLLHDIGKPDTKAFQSDGRMRFFGHSDVGAEIAVKLMRRLRFSSREITMVRNMIDAHLRPVQLGEQGAPTRKAIYKFFRDTGEAAIDTMFLSLADHLATVGPRVSIDGFRRHVALIDRILRVRYEESHVISPPKLISGDDLMANLGLEPGPILGLLLEAVREAQASGDVETRAQALEVARRRLAEEALPAGEAHR